LAVQELIQPIRNLSKLSELKNDQLLEIAEKAGKYFSEKKDLRDKNVVDVTSTKIRKFQSQIVQCFYRSKIDSSFDPSDIKLLKYHLAYAAAREAGNRKFLDFKNFFDAALDKIRDKADIDRLRQLYDATLSYHAFFAAHPEKNEGVGMTERGPNRYGR